MEKLTATLFSDNFQGQMPKQKKKLLYICTISKPKGALLQVTLDAIKVLQTVFEHFRQ